METVHTTLIDRLAAGRSRDMFAIVKESCRSLLWNEIKKKSVTVVYAVVT